MSRTTEYVEESADDLATAHVVSSFHLSPSSCIDSFTSEADTPKGRIAEGLKKKAKKQFLKEDEVLEEENQSASPEERIQEIVRRGVDGATLDLSYMRLSTCPSTLTDVGDAVSTLYLQKNYISELPEDFGVLGQLRQLDAHNNRLTHIPASIAMCENLTYLNLSSNMLTGLPDELEDCSQLEHIILDFNYLKEFPSVCLKLPKLQSLYLIENSNVQTLPDYNLFEKRSTGGSESSPDFAIHIDNTTALQQQWKEYHGRLSGLSNRRTQITITWNRIWPDHVEDGVYLGSLRTTQNPAVFTELGITHVLTCGRNLRTSLPSGIAQLVLEVDDNEEERLDRHFQRAFDFMSPEGSSDPKKVLVHCFAGVSRSATMVIAYHMYVKKKGFREAYEFVEKQRPVINPNQNFRKQLQDWETVVMSKK